MTRFAAHSWHATQLDKVGELGQGVTNCSKERSSKEAPYYVLRSLFQQGTRQM